MGSGDDKSEIALLDIWKFDKHFKIFSIYSPPGSTPDFSFLDVSRSSIFIGDFNAHSPRWGYRDLNHAGEAVEDLLNSKPFELIFSKDDVHTYIHYNGTKTNPDLLLVTPDLKDNCNRRILDDPGSGHRQIVAEFSFRPSQLNKPVSKTSWNFRKARWKAFESLLDRKLDPSRLDFNQTIERLYKTIIHSIIWCAKQTIPRGKVERYKCFWSTYLMELKSKRDRFRRRAELSGRSQDVKAWRRQAAVFKKSLLKEKRTTMGEFISNLDFQRDGIRAFSFLAKIKNSHAKAPKRPFLFNNRTLASDQKVANSFVQYFADSQRKGPFARCHSRKVIQKLKFKANAVNPVENNVSIFNAPIGSTELRNSLKCLQNCKSPGEDNIFSEFLIHLGTRAFESILRFFNKIWSSGCLPSHWGKSTVIPIYKKDKDPGAVQSYRPISLTSIFCKTFERIIINRLNWFLETKGILEEEQAGFRRLRSTNHHVALLSQSIKDALDNRRILSAVFVDFKSAYDLVWRENLLLKLSDLGVQSNMLNWFRGFLNYRICRVRYNNCYSKFRSLKTGLPQGAVSSCTLFNIYINDLVTKLKSIDGIKCLLFADDLVVWTESPKSVAKQSIEPTLNKAMLILESWSEENNMKVNLEKTFVQSFSLSHQPFHPQISYKNSTIPLTEKYKYLGVTFDRKLSWNSHIEDVTRRASKRLSLLKILAGSKWGCSRSTLNQTYNSYVLPILTYCCEPLITSSKKILDSLEKLQNQALRLITGAVKSTPIDFMLLCTNNRPLSLIIKERALLLWEKIIRTPGCLSMWDQVSTKTGRNLKTQRGFVQGVVDLISHFNIDFRVQQFLLPRSPIEAKSFSLRIALLQGVSKAEDGDQVLRSVAYETINTLYPIPHWLRVYTDGSKTSDCTNIGAGVHCELFSFYSPVGASGSAFDGEIFAIRLALIQLQCRFECFSNVVLLSDSRAALQAINFPSSSRSKVTDDCINLLSWLSDHNKTVVLQWIPAHCGIEGNETADFLAKKGASVSQLNIQNLAYHSIKAIVKKTLGCSYSRDIASRSGHRSWFDRTHDIPEWPRDKSVALLRLFSGHDCLRKHLHRINLASDPLCLLCDSQEEMDMSHLASCTAIPPGPIWKRYWFARLKLMD